VEYDPGISHTTVSRAAPDLIFTHHAYSNPAETGAGFHWNCIDITKHCSKQTTVCILQSIIMTLSNLFIYIASSETTLLVNHVLKTYRTVSAKKHCTIPLLYPAGNSCIKTWPHSQRPSRTVLWQTVTMYSTRICLRDVV